MFEWLEALAPHKTPSAPDDGGVGKQTRVPPVAGGPGSYGEPVQTESGSQKPLPGMFENLARLFAPVVGAAEQLWDSVTGHADPAHKPGTPGKPVTPGKPEAPKLPDSDEAWQAEMAHARAEVTVQQRYAVPTRALNPDLLFAVRIANVEHRDTFYDVLTHKDRTKGRAGPDLTPGQLAYQLGSALETRAEAEARVPELLAGKLALLDKAAPGGAIDTSKSAGGTLRVALGKDLGKAARARIDDWIKAHYQGARLIVSAVEVAELRTLITDVVGATARDPERDARIEQLRADTSACEVRVRALLRRKASETKAGAAQTLWNTLAELAERDGVFVDRALESYRIEAEDGSTTKLDPALLISVNYLNPGGLRSGGGSYRDATVDDVLAGEYAGDPGAADKAAAAKKFIHTLNRNEGGPASMNTWDGEIVSAGPGLSGGGRLQKSMRAYKVADPAGFHDALGKFGVDIVAGKGNPYFTVRVPDDINAIPPALRALVTPGQVIIGSATTGASKGGDTYQECAALRYISKDPVLMSRFMYAGQHSYQRFLIEEAADSMHKAELFSFLVDEQRIGWTALISPLGQDWLAATEAVIAYRYHASASTYEALKVKAADHYRASFGADRAPASLTTSERKQIGRFVAWQLKPGKYKVYREQFPSVADEVFPPAKSSERDDDGVDP